MRARRGKARSALFPDARANSVRPMFLRTLALFVLALPAVTGRAAIEWEKTLVFAAATPSEGKAMGHFPFTNTGAYPVKITGLKTTCGCTAAAAEKRVIAPGEKGEIVVAYKTIGRRGLHEAPITVKTDDRSAAETVLKMRVLVQDMIELQPTFLFWKKDEPLSPKKIAVKVTDGFSAGQLAAASSDPKVGVTLETVKPGSEYALVVTPMEGAERLKARLTLTSQNDRSGRRDFTAFVRVR
jgi:hypothetical protein